MPHLKIYVWIILIFPHFPVQAQKITINFKPEPGFSYQTELSSSINFIQEFMGISYTTSTKINLVIDNEVSFFAEESGYQIKSKYARIDFSMKGHMLDLEMSSLSEDTTNPMNIMMRSLIGQQFIQYISYQAELLAIDGLEELINHQLDKLNLQEEQKKEFGRNFHDSFGEEAIRENISRNIIYYPADAVQAGDDWFRSLTIRPYGIPMHLLINVKLKELTEGTAVFISEGTLAARRNDISPNVKTDPSYDLAGTHISEVRINLKNGLIMNSITTQFIHGKVNTPDPNFPDKSIEIPLRIESRYTCITR